MSSVWLFLAALVVCAEVNAQGVGTSVVFSSAGANNTEVRASATAAGSDTSRIALTISNSAQQFQLTVLQRGNASDALAAQQARTGWKDGYLFVRDDCLAPNEAKRPWRCVVDRVFTFVEGSNGKRLAYIGEVHAGDDCAEEAKFGCAVYDQLFTDIYDKLEHNAVLAPEESPALLLEMRVKSGEFVVDLDETWGRNQERFNAGNRCLAATPAERTTACIDGITPPRAYLFNASLATYTRRTDSLMRVHAYARTALCGEVAESKNDDVCRERLRLSALMLASIKPGERPRPRGGVTSILAPAGKSP